MTNLYTDRRASPRRQSCDEHGIVHARVRPGHAAMLIDVSAGGALVETGRRVLPDTFAEVYMETPSRQASVRGRVLRCAVVSVGPTAIRYRAAIQFDSYLPWFAEDVEMPLTEPEEPVRC
jgi:hypothetical protein